MCGPEKAECECMMSLFQIRQKLNSVSLLIG